ncbi:apolipoprotein N-acyltransferase [Epidermidibacterium keratini]|uniref:Apolipoprotein N-acyltransferase n=1 Tax=Epidermidibacterium keratini TaxID=1891644 RepID=A0A7L4YS42_9ACTN|nr:apolipoprotein N-acyltransferase [Epidermidibacterium keratini]QHC02045.1 apolipoprotein N-acyltransferase [Epidermidibacterium keratini]
MRGSIVRLLAAAAGGLVLAFAFPPGSINRPFAVLAVALLGASIIGRRMRFGALAGMAFGSAFLFPHLSWSGEFLGWLPWTALSIWQATYFALLGALLVPILRLRWWPVPAACAWVAVEALQGRWPFGGFPWARLGFSQDAGPFTPFAAIGGVPLLSFAVALCGFTLAYAVHALAAREGARPAIIRFAVAALVPLIGWAGWLIVPSGADEQDRATIAVIQGDVPREGLDFNEQRRAVLDNHVNQTLKLADQVAAGEVAQPDFVLWPENSSDIDPYTNADAATRIQQAADAIDAPILIGAVVQGPGENVRNMGVLWLPQTGPDQTYTKRHPVPFAEYMPAREFFATFTDLVNLLQVEFVAGTEVGEIDVPGTEGLVVGDVICFEVAYDGLVASSIDAGATLLAVQTNNATFGYTNEPYQQLAMGRIRAVEHGRTVLSASTSGVSAVISPDGEIIDRTGELFTPGILVADVPLRTEPTIAARLGAIPEWTMTGTALLAAAYSIYRRRTGGDSTSSDETDRPQDTDGPDDETHYAPAADATRA